jgi:hypothetical protein
MVWMFGLWVFAIMEITKHDYRVPNADHNFVNTKCKTNFSVRYDYPLRNI